MIVYENDELCCRWDGIHTYIPCYYRLTEEDFSDSVFSISAVRQTSPWSPKREEAAFFEFSIDAGKDFLQTYRHIDVASSRPLSCRFILIVAINLRSLHILFLFLESSLIYDNNVASSMIPSASAASLLTPVSLRQTCVLYFIGIRNNYSCTSARTIPMEKE
jgi:hypothetical protein